MQEPDTPPIVSPSSDFGDKTPSSSRKWKGYAGILGWGVLAFVLLLLLNRFAGLFFIGLFSIAVYVITAIYLTYLVDSLGKRLQFCVRSHDDLRHIRRVVDMNMKFAYLFMGVMYAFLAAFLVTRNFLCLFLLSIVCMILSPFLLRVEAKFKAMKVASEDPSVAAEFADIIAQWKEPKFGLNCVD
jgi:hypothetical protein